MIGEVLRRPRDDSRLTADVVAMRKEIATHKPPNGELDVKLVPGGLVDLGQPVRQPLPDQHLAGLRLPGGIAGDRGMSAADKGV